MVISFVSFSAWLQRRSYTAGARAEHV